ncbi:hypothetical protein BV25DRAFT_1916401 [Artomyces pyxidatus]|uniref:Uncharacterized protein n=1 Tax=Artomyces pyxidatus TaxID=48021 RepID=A0ACB8T0X2_9AGAM|nr:hypothetical protein BV25DRAFT_1916401 [Artomyces pyxidatus]
MELRFSRNNLLNTVLRDERGEPLFRIHTTPGWTGRITTVSRFVAGRKSTSYARPPVEGVRRDNASDTDIHLMGLEEREVAQIEWHAFRQSVFCHGGQKKKIDSYMPGKGVLQRRRIFTASDGRAYRWVLGMRTCWLKTDDGNDAKLARFHRSSTGIIGEAHNTFLEISPEAVPILEELVMTFIWVERRREQREKAGKKYIWMKP